MYLTDALILNSGPIHRLVLRPQFNPDGSPKPLILVGSNGSGKTEFLSIVADGLIEIACQHFQNITETVGLTRQYFRIIGSRSQRVGEIFQLSALKFKDGPHDLYYRAKGGEVSPATIAQELKPYGPVATWLPKSNQNEKVAEGPENEIARIYDSGAYVFFPSMRFEIPHWANAGVLEREPEGDFSMKFAQHLSKPIVVQSTLQSLKPWIMNVLLDSLGAIFRELPSVETIEMLREKINSDAIILQHTFEALNEIVRIILQRAEAHIVWLGRASGERRIAVFFGNQLGIPSLDSLSAGQATLLSIFGTILHYGDTGSVPRPLDQIEGIVLIDEADAHLHADLQHDALPKLIRSFRRVQFIVTSHSPLFPVGMKKVFGDDGFTLIELPSGSTIDPERFSEFESSFEYFRATQAFENSIQEKVAQNQKPLVLCEGKTDLKYLKTAAELLGMDDILQQTEFDWVGLETKLGAKGSGKEGLDNALKFLRYNTNLIQRRVVLLYDCDARKTPEGYENRLFVRSLPVNRDNTMRRDGIENLLPNVVFEDRFFVDITHGSDKGHIRELQKIKLCDYLCDEKRAASDFEKFKGILEELLTLLVSEV